MDVYQHTRDFTRYGCIIGAKPVPYSTLEQWYVCAECGARPVHTIQRIDDVTVDGAHCARCGCEDFLSAHVFDRQCAEFFEIVHKLPDHLRILVEPEKPARMTADEAIASLFEL